MKAEDHPKKTERFSEARMPDIAAPAYLHEMADRVSFMMRVLGGASQKERINRVAAFVRPLTPRRIAGIFYKEARCIDTGTGDLIRQRSEYLRARTSRLEAEYEAIRRELVAQAPRGLARLCPPALPALEIPQAEVAQPPSEGGVPRRRVAR